MLLSRVMLLVVSAAVGFAAAEDTGAVISRINNMLSTFGSRDECARPGVLRVINGGEALEYRYAGLGVGATIECRHFVAIVLVGNLNKRVGNSNRGNKTYVDVPCREDTLCVQIRVEGEELPPDHQWNSRENLEKYHDWNDIGGL